MRDHHDFQRMEGVRNPYIGELKESITIRLDRPTIAYFKQLASDLGLPYQTLINLYLRDCVVSGRKLPARWIARRGSAKRPARAPSPR